MRNRPRPATSAERSAFGGVGVLRVATAFQPRHVAARQRRLARSAGSWRVSRVLIGRPSAKTRRMVRLVNHSYRRFCSGCDGWLTRCSVRLWASIASPERAICARDASEAAGSPEAPPDRNCPLSRRLCHEGEGVGRLPQAQARSGGTAQAAVALLQRPTAPLPDPGRPGLARGPSPRARPRPVGAREGPDPHDPPAPRSLGATR